MSFNQEQDPLGLLLSRTYLAYKKKASHLLQDYNITPEQFGVLNNLVVHVGISQKALAELFSKDQTSIGKTIDRLENKKLITRTVDPADRRAVLLHLTTQGQELVAHTQPIMKEVDDEINALLPPEQVQQFIATINQLFNHLSR